MRYFVTLNIGLRDQSGAEITQSCVFHCLKAIGASWHHTRLVEDAPEPTLVVEAWDAPDSAIHQLCLLLDQECIAVWDLMHSEGRLVGPGKDKWGEFDPALFYLTDGKTMAERIAALIEQVFS